MKVSRIGHGYHLLDNEESYQKYGLSGRIHFEGCPLSSYMTGSVPPNWKQHPFIKWVRDKVNFSISTDDPTCFDNTMITDCELAHYEIGLTIDEIKNCVRLLRFFHINIFV